MINNLSERDRQVLWHPYTQMQTHGTALPITSGKGACLYAADGRTYLDAISSWWVNLHGHAHPYIAEKIYAQCKELEHVIFAGFTHKPAIELAERLLCLLPALQKKVFYSDNGSTAVEVALKMCIQFWHNLEKPRTKILAFKNSYHGDTFGAMSVSSRSVWTSPFEQFIFDVQFLDIPHKNNIDSLLEEISMVHAESACFIYEPLIQGAGGMNMYEARYLDDIMHVCRDLGILLIQDEVFTGFGRTGKLFASNYLKEQPDIMCFSKGLTGGTLPLGITSCSDEIYNAFLSDTATKTLFHGHSFTANPLACTAALASLDLLLHEQTQKDIQRICFLHQRFKLDVEQHPNVREVRLQGTVIAIEWETKEDTHYFNRLRERLYGYFLDKGILMRPLGNIVYLVPPYCMSDDELFYIYESIKKALDELI